MSNHVRVLQVFGKLNRCGAETMVMNLYRNIDRSKVQFDFIVHTNEHCDYDDEISSLGGKIYRVPRYNGKNHFIYKKSWNEFFQKHTEYKIIHGHVRSTASIYLKIAKKHGLITISHSHSTSSGSGFSAIVKNLLQYSIRFTADYLFACSKSAGEWLFGKKACKKKNFFILNNSIDSAKFTYDKNVRIKKRKELKSEDKYIIGHIGRFHLEKNHNFLIDIFKEVYDKSDNLVLLLVGDGELRKSIKTKVKNLGLTNSVIFAGVREDIPELLQAMDVFLLPSLYEGLGIVAIEAQAAGLQTIVSETIPKEAYITDLIEKEYLSSSPTIWANRILKYKNGYVRKDRHKEISNAGYDIKENSKVLENFYIEQHNTFNMQ